MTTELGFLAAMTIGFLGSTHCVGMCGGIVGALYSTVPQSAQYSKRVQWVLHVMYNGGRVLSYTFAGALAGLAGAQSARIPLETALPVGTVVAGVFMVALGLYLAGWWPAFGQLEKLGQFLWKYIQPLGTRFLPAKSPGHAFGLGLVWGWLPCGLVYTALAMALVSASPMQGALLMLGFGLGTLPMLLVMGHAYEMFGKTARRPSVQRVAGVAVILFGAYTLLNIDRGHDHADGLAEAPSLRLSDGRHVP